MDLIDKLAEWFTALGPLGLFLAAALDSFVPLSHVVDPMVVYLSYKHDDPVTFALVATVGSVLGSSVFFFLVRAGGDGIAEKLIRPGLRNKLTRTLERYGLVAIIIGGVMPPPFPLKGLVLVAALARMPLPIFVLGFTVSRLVRYGLESTTAVFYGDQALEITKQYYPLVGLAAVTVTLGFWLIGRKLMGGSHQALATGAETPPAPTRDNDSAPVDE